MNPIIAVDFDTLAKAAYIAAFVDALYSLADLEGFLDTIPADLKPLIIEHTERVAAEALRDLTN